jgi:hypothetical protein
MTDLQRSERPMDEPEAAKRPWSPPVLDVIGVADDTEGAGGLKDIDSVTAVS